MIKVGITQGDLNGIGYEVIFKTFADSRLLEIITPVVYGSMKLALAQRKIIGLPQVNLNQISSAEQIVKGKVNVINCVDENVKIELGISTEASGQTAFQSLDRAVNDLTEGFIDVLVTSPINKDNIQSEEFQFHGHTEYLESKFLKNEDEKGLMLLVSDGLRIAVATGHIPLSKVPEEINAEKIKNDIGLLYKTLKVDFSIEIPKIAILSLNPHAGENGLLGTEEKDILIPAIENLQNEMITCYGPFAADGFFGSNEYKKYDAILAMYHDQGLIPFKTLAMESGVNFTAGLPIVRTSPAHGTAYDIAGKGIASEASFRSAIYLALDIFKNRKFSEESKLNPLKKIFFSRGNDNAEIKLSSAED